DLQLPAEPGLRPPHQPDPARARQDARRRPRPAGGRAHHALPGRSLEDGALMVAEGRKAAPETALAYLELAAKFLAARAIPSARLDAEVLLAQVLATDRVGVYLRFDRPLGRAEVDDYRALVKRRADGEPVAHLTGRREFWSRSLVVTPDVLIPRPE